MTMKMNFIFLSLIPILHISSIYTQETTTIENPTSSDLNSTLAPPLPSTAEKWVRPRRQPPHAIIKHFIRAVKPSKQIRRIKIPKIKYGPPKYAYSGPINFYKPMPSLPKHPPPSYMYNEFQHMKFDESDLDLPPSSYEAQAMTFDFYSGGGKQTSNKAPRIEYSFTSKDGSATPSFSFKGKSNRSPHTKYGIPTNLEYATNFKDSGNDHVSSSHSSFEGVKDYDGGGVQHITESDHSYASPPENSFETISMFDGSYDLKTAYDLPRKPANKYGPPATEHSYEPPPPDYSLQSNKHSFAEPPTPPKDDIEIQYSPPYEISLPPSIIDDSSYKHKPGHFAEPPEYLPPEKPSSYQPPEYSPSEEPSAYPPEYPLSEEPAPYQPEPAPPKYEFKHPPAYNPPRKPSHQSPSSSAYYPPSSPEYHPPSEPVHQSSSSPSYHLPSAPAYHPPSVPGHQSSSSPVYHPPSAPGQRPATRMRNHQPSSPGHQPPSASGHQPPSGSGTQPPTGSGRGSIKYHLLNSPEKESSSSSDYLPPSGPERHPPSQEYQAPSSPGHQPPSGPGYHQPSSEYHAPSFPGHRPPSGSGHHQPSPEYQSPSSPGHQPPSGPEHHRPSSEYQSHNSPGHQPPSAPASQPPSAPAYQPPSAPGHQASNTKGHQQPQSYFDEDDVPSSQELPLTPNHKQPPYDFPKSSYEVPIYDPLPFDSSNTVQEYYPPHSSEDFSAENDAVYEPKNKKKFESSNKRPSSDTSNKRYTDSRIALTSKRPKHTRVNVQKATRTNGGQSTATSSKHILDAPELKVAFEAGKRKTTKRYNSDEPETNESSKRHSYVSTTTVKTTLSTESHWNPVRVRISSRPVRQEQKSKADQTSTTTKEKPSTEGLTTTNSRIRQRQREQWKHRDIYVTPTTVRPRDIVRGSTKKINIISIEKSKSHSYYDGTLPPPTTEIIPTTTFRYRTTRFNLPTKLLTKSTPTKRTTKTVIDTTHFKSPILQNSQIDRDDELTKLLELGQNLPKNHKLY